MIFTKKDIERIVYEALQEALLLEVQTKAEKRGKLTAKERAHAKEIFDFYKQGGFAGPGERFDIALKTGGETGGWASMPMGAPGSLKESKSYDILFIEGEAV